MSNNEVNNLSCNEGKIVLDNSLNILDKESSDDDVLHVQVKFWTEKKCLKLIRLYRSKPLLWSAKDPLYYRTPMKQKAWTEIAKAFGKPVEACKNKMGILMSSFRREKSKIVHSNGAYRSVWFAFNDMQFLMDRKTRVSIDNCDKVANYIIQMDEDSEDIEEDMIIPKTEQLSDKFCHISEDSRKEGQDLNDDFLNISNNYTSEININQITHIEDSETASFLNFIGNKMKKYDEQTKLVAQQAICDVMFKLDRTFYKSSNQDPLSRGESSNSRH